MTTKANLLLDPTSCLNKACTEEPVFLLRANDPVAAAAIRHWATMGLHYHSNEKRQGALDIGGGGLLIEGLEAFGGPLLDSWLETHGRGYFR